MMHVSGRWNRFVLATAALACVGAFGCRDAETSPKIIQTPSGPMRDLGTVIVDVDVKRGIVTVHPVSGSVDLPPGVDAKYFGNDHEIQYRFSGVPQGTYPNGDVDFNLHANFDNLLNFQIGTNSPYTYPNFPQDTMGVYVYFTIPPYQLTTLGGPCAPPTCRVDVDSADGTYPFTNGIPQPYHYWKTILEGGGTNGQTPGPFQTNQSTLPGAGHINYFRPFSFRTSPNVSTFRFSISMAAAWVDPQESRWKVFYVGDSIPTRDSLQALHSEPDWRRLGTTGSVSITPAACAPNTGACKLTLLATAGDSIMFYRSDSLRASQNGYIAATLSPSAMTGAEPGVFLGLKDPVKLVELGISTTLTGFTDSTGTLLPATTFLTDLGRTSYRVAKYGTDSASIFSPANSTAAIKTVLYSALPPAPVRGSGPPNYDRFFFFGNMTASAASTAATSLWSNVNYEIGAAEP
jgi:hypothetical protein